MSIHQLRHKDTAPQGADVVESDAEYDVKRRANVGADNAEFTYINVYLADRAYGGSEEGGWWYDYGIPVESRRVKLPPIGYENPYSEYQEELEFIESRYYRLNQGRPEIHSVTSEGRYVVVEEDEFARAYPYKCPHYE